MDYIHITRENIDKEHLCCAQGRKREFLALAGISDCVAGKTQNATGG